MDSLSFLLRIFALLAICQVNMESAAYIATNTHPDEFANHQNKNAAEYGQVAGETLIAANSSKSPEVEGHTQQNDNLVMTTEQAPLNATESLQPGSNETEDQDTKKRVKNVFSILSLTTAEGEILALVFITVFIIFTVTLNHYRNTIGVHAASHRVKDSMKYSTIYKNAEFPIWHLHQAFAHGAIQNKNTSI